MINVFHRSGTLAKSWLRSTMTVSSSALKIATACLSGSPGLTRAAPATVGGVGLVWRSAGRSWSRMAGRWRPPKETGRVASRYLAFVVIARAIALTIPFLPHSLRRQLMLVGQWFLSMGRPLARSSRQGRAISDARNRLIVIARAIALTIPFLPHSLRRQLMLVGQRFLSRMGCLLARSSRQGRAIFRRSQSFD